MVYKFPLSIPTFNCETENWTETVFQTREDFLAFTLSLIKEPGQYEFDESVKYWNQHATYFNIHKQYEGSKYPELTKDRKKWWNKEKSKCRKGVIYINRDKTFYLTRWYYDWLNFMKIYDKAENDFVFPKIWDVHYDLGLCIVSAELDYKNIALLKKRQIGSSLFFLALIINCFWFERGAVLKLGASLGAYLGMDDGCWKTLDFYRSFRNQYTDWYRPCNPDKVGNWIQQREAIDVDGKKTNIGRKSSIKATSFEKSPTNGVGGPCVSPYTSILCENSKIKLAKDITLEDKVIGADGLPKRVLHLFSGQTEMYKVSQSKGESYIVTGDHTLYLFDITKKEHVKIQAKDFNNLSENKKRFLKGVKFNGVINEHINLPINPYYLGLYLGDGCKYDYKILVNNTKDLEIFEELKKISNETGYQLSIKRRNNYRKDYNDEMLDVSLSSGYKVKTKKPKINHAFNSLNLNKKHIPELFFNSSEEQRLDLLAGILDTDGYYNKLKNRYEIHVKDEVLKNDIIKLCIELGFDAKYNKIIENNRSSSVVNTITEGFRIRITGDLTKIPCRLQRKKALKNGVKNKNRFSTIKVEKIGIGDYNGFQCEDNLFVLEDGTVTHNCTFFFHEEGGIAPKADMTFGYMDPAMKVGMVRTGVFMIAGSVGELSQCKPLEKWIKNPGSDFFSRETSLIDGKGTKGRCGLFIPEQWSMPPYIDEYGNSLVDKALKAIEEDRKNFREAIKRGEKTEEEYRLYVSQHPTNIKEAFDWRDVSAFPVHIIQKQKDKILKGEVYREFLDIERNQHGVPEFKPCNRQPLKFPTEKTLPDKRGCIIVTERPLEKIPKFGMYYGTVDPVGTGITTSSKSLFCIQIWKAPMETIIHEAGESRVVYTPEKLVASWTGRFDDEDENHEYASMLIEMYNAWTIVESNIKLFNQYMKLKKRLKYLVPSSQIRGFKSDNIDSGSDLEYGWKNTGRLFVDVLLKYGIEGIKEVIDEQYKTNGEVVQKHYAVENIGDEWLLEEMLLWREGENVDRLICYCAMKSFIKLQVAHRGVTKRVENKDLENNKNLYTLNTKTPFKNIGNSNFKSENPLYNIRKSNFKNLR